MSDIKDRLDEAKLLLNHLKFHLATVQEQKHRIAEKKLKSQLVTQDGEAEIIKIKASHDDTLKARVEYFYLCREELDIIAEIRSKVALITQYEAHYDATIKEETKAISDREILAAINEMNNLPLKGEVKQQANNLASDFTTGNVVGLVPRYEYLESIKNFIKENS
jgi:hypothetical protein